MGCLEAAPKICNKKPIDVSIVIDGSDSKRNDFEKQKEFVKKLVSHFAFGNIRTRVAISCIGTDAQSRYKQSGFGLLDGTSKQEVLNQLQNIEPIGGKALLGRALLRNGGAKTFIDEHARQVLIVLTDGNSPNPSTTREDAALLHKAGVQTWVVALGGDTAWGEIQQIASDSDHIAALDDLQNVDDKAFKEYIVARTCKDI